MSLMVLVLEGKWQRGSCPRGVIILWSSCPGGSCPQGSCPRGSCPRANDTQPHHRGVHLPHHMNRLIDRLECDGLVICGLPLTPLTTNLSTESPK